MTQQHNQPPPSPSPSGTFEPLAMFGDLIREGQNNTTETLKTLNTSIEAHNKSTDALTQVVGELVAAVKAIVQMAEKAHTDADAKMERALLKQEQDRQGKIIYGVAAIAGSAVVLAIVRLVMAVGG